MYTVENSNGQLKLSYSNLVEFYQFPTFKSVSFAFDTIRSNYYVSINFISNDKNNSLRLYLVDITNQSGWTDDVTGANNAVTVISSWISSALIPNLSGVGIIKKSELLRLSLTTGAITYTVNSIEVTNVGTDDALFSSNGGVSFEILKKGERISYDAGAINNFFPPENFHYNASGTSELLITYVYI